MSVFGVAKEAGKFFGGTVTKLPTEGIGPSAVIIAGTA